MRVEARFWAKTEEAPNGCLEWTAGGKGHGYGGFGIAGTVAVAHRVAFALAKGPIPAGLLVRHACHNRCCVNPDHLELGTHAENTKDMTDAGRMLTGPGAIPRKLDVTDAWGVFGARMLGFSYAEIAAAYGVGAQTVSDILADRTWAKARQAHADEVHGTPETPAAAP